jgi:hypothetical protein
MLILRTWIRKKGEHDEGCEVMGTTWGDGRDRARNTEVSSAAI